ncbi:HAD-IIB family hydrolase [Pasteurella sp. PK-2025]|uniref:HAD-IIB family hydrolase n=1 Tax=Pasteurella sp. PK-2025 TaxID=3413133 RepID=UPI003C75E312
MKTIVFDIDGTISQSGKPVSIEICEYLTALSQTHHIVFASARPVRDMLPMIAKPLHHNALFIGCNGGMAFKQGQFLFTHTLEKKYLEQALAILKQQHIPYVLDGHWGYAFSKVAHPFQGYIKSLSDAEEEEEALIQTGVTKLLVLTDEPNNALISTLNQRNISLHIHKGENFFDITPQGNNKYRTLNTLLGKQQYIAFGNDQNDFLMLDNAETAVFVGDANTYPTADYYTMVDKVLEVIQSVTK